MTVEANYDLTERLTIEGYSIETEKIGLGTNLARSILLIDNQINYTRLNQYDYEGISAVWVQLSMSSSNNPVFMAGYRQWNLSSDCKATNPNLLDQNFRYSKILDISSKVIQKYKNVVIMMDDNIDTFNNFTTIDRCRNSVIKDMRDNFFSKSGYYMFKQRANFF